MSDGLRYPDAPWPMRWEDDPCLERRHHRELHIYELGRYEPVGGYLRD